jgi:hypothetical protein
MTIDGGETMIEVPSIWNILQSIHQNHLRKETSRLRQDNFLFLGWILQEMEKIVALCQQRVDEMQIKIAAWNAKQQAEKERQEQEAREKLEQERIEKEKAMKLEEEKRAALIEAAKHLFPIAVSANLGNKANTSNGSFGLPPTLGVPAFGAVPLPGSTGSGMPGPFGAPSTTSTPFTFTFGANQAASPFAFGNTAPSSGSSSAATTPGTPAGVFTVPADFQVNLNLDSSSSPFKKSKGKSSTPKK